MAAAMSVQSPYIRLGSSDASETTTLRMSMESPHGDPFTLLNIFNEWIRIKHRRSESSFKWCRRHGLEEQRLYEIAKLQKQFEGVLSESGVAGGRGEGRAEGEPGEAGDGEVEEAWNSGVRGGERGEHRDGPGCWRVEDVDWVGLGLRVTGEGHAGWGLAIKGEVWVELVGELLGYMEMLETSRVFLCNVVRLPGLPSMVLSSSRIDTNRTMTRLLVDKADVALLKWVLCSGLYPRVGLPHDKNVERNEKEARFHTKHCRDASLHPTCVLNQKELQPAPGRSRRPGVQVGEDGGVNEEGDSSDSDAEGKDGGKCGGQSEAAKLDFMRSKDLELRVDVRKLADASCRDLSQWLLFTLESEEDSARLLEVATAVRVTVAALVKRRLQRSSHSRAGVGALGELRHTTVLGPEMLAKLPEAVQRIYNIATQ
eukprot:gene22140-26686_t